MDLADEVQRSTVDEMIEVVAYDSAWPQVFEGEKSRILSKTQFFDLAIEHFGSTSIVGMKAKPIVDILIGFRPRTNIAKLVVTLESLGYEHLGQAGVPGRAAFRRRGERNFNIAAFELNSDAYRNNIAIREYLRNSPDACREYEKIKEESLEGGSGTLIQYSMHKFEYVKELERRAKAYVKEKCP